MYHIIAPVRDFLMYERCIHTNVHVRADDILKHSVDNREKNNNISIIYNEFIESLPMAEESWLIFCHEDFEFLSSPALALSHVDKEAVYGVFGARLVSSLSGNTYHEYIGKIFDKDKKGKNSRILGTDFVNGTIVDTLDCQCVMVHSTIVHRYGLRFDPNLTFNLYAEDFCLEAKIKYGVPARVLNIPCCHHSQAHTLEDRPSFAVDLAYCDKKFKGKGQFAGVCNVFNGDEGPVIRENILFQEPAPKDGSDIYRQVIDPKNNNLPVVLSAAMMRARSTILDVGCASGDNGIFLQKQLGASLWGMEYNPVSVERAKKTCVYTDVFHCDVDNFFLHDYGRFYHFFDHIFLGDVLEHVTNPLRALKKLAFLLKKGGTMLVSLPNLAHVYVLGNLLRHDFRYRDWGILDATHLRFFTYKSMARLFAGAGLKAKAGTATFLMPDEYPVLHTPKILPDAVYSLFSSDKKFFACQFVAALQASQEPVAVLERWNMKVLEEAVEKNPEGWQQKEAAFERFQVATRVAAGEPFPEEMRRWILALCKEEKYEEAIVASQLFAPQWYLETYPDVAAAGVSAWAHYFSHGWREGRNPSELFDTKWYLATCPEVAEAGICPLLHYIGRGIAMGFAPCPPRH